MPISFKPMREYLVKHGISYYYLSNHGIDAQTLQRIRHDRPLTTTTLGKVCEILRCQPGELMEYVDTTTDDSKRPL